MKNTIIFFFLILNSIFSYCQNSKKATNDYYKELHKIDINEIKNGKHLELAKLFTIETFVSYYLAHGKVRDTKKNRIQTITQLYSDSEFTYFGKTYSFELLDFFKVVSNDLSKMDRLDGNKIRKEFIEQIVPTADKEKVKRKEKGCIFIFENPKFTYQYHKSSNTIQITYKWKISCDFLKIINKTYTAKLNLTNYTLTK